MDRRMRQMEIQKDMRAKMETRMHMRNQIEQKWEQIAGEYPLLGAEMETCGRELTPEEVFLLKAVYASLSVHDWVSYPPKALYSYVQATQRVMKETTYAGQIPEDVFFTYLLPVRVNNEDLDGSRMWLYEQLRERIAGKNMEEAALLVNYWCYEKATYATTDDRTIAPFGMCRRTKGRCGEESVLLVSALRAAGIPARQCYVPRWAHCDDNHAWVEAWIDGTWHYMGACEPEPVLDKGWFTAAASKAMLIRARQPQVGPDAAGYSLVNVTSSYGETACLRVKVVKNGQAQAGVSVRFQLVNYSELFSLYEEISDVDGYARMETGLGDLYVCAFADGCLVGKKVDVRKDTEVVLELVEGIQPDNLSGEITERFDLIPPTERVECAKMEAVFAQQEAHQKQLHICEAVREQYESSFVWEGARWLVEARGNQKEIRTFLAMEEFSMEDKCALLETLRDKDFVDTEAEVLASFLRASLTYKNQYPAEVWTDGILAPRVENEKLWDIRGKIQELLKDQTFSSADEVQEWMNGHIRMVQEYGLTNRFANYAGCIRHGACPASKRRVLLVEICRAVGIPARLNAVTKTEEWWDKKAQTWMPVGAGESKKYEKNEKDGENRTDEKYEKGEREDTQSTDTLEMCALHLVCRQAFSAVYREHMTVEYWNGSDYDSLNYEDMRFEKDAVLKLKKGSYRVLTARRQIDGTVSVWMKAFLLDSDKTVEIQFREDQTEEKQKKEVLPEVWAVSLNGHRRQNLLEQKRTGSLLIYAEPGKEPTEHLFLELLEWKEAYNQEQYPIFILLVSEDGQKNETLQHVLRELKYSSIWIAEDAGARQQLLACMGVGDERLPFAVAVDAGGLGRFAFANYNIRTAQTLFRILQLANRK